MTDRAVRIAAWARGLGRTDTDVEWLGAGESYDAWRVGAWVVRLARRPLAELPRPLGAEAAALSLLPEGIGPKPVLVEPSPEVLGAPFVVTTYVPGREVPFEGWTDDLLVAHAHQLARLHARPFDREPFSLVEQLAASLAWWRDRHPEALEAAASLVPRVTAYVTERDALFTRRTRFALVHGDLVVTNVVVADGVPRFIDWEWGAIGDPAQDLALLGGPISAEPWYLPLSAQRLALLLDAYRDAVGPDGDLEARRDAYEVFERFLNSLYLRVRGHSALDRVTEGLIRRLM